MEMSAQDGNTLPPSGELQPDSNSFNSEDNVEDRDDCIFFEKEVLLHYYYYFHGIMMLLIDTPLVGIQLSFLFVFLCRLKQLF